MDLTESITPKSDQLNAEDLLTGPRTFTVAEVREGSSEQPVNVHLVELPGRPYRPSKSMRRVLATLWGKDTKDWPEGGRFTLYRDAKVTFGRDVVGGIKISHLSHISERASLALTVTPGKRAPHVVEPLPELSRVDQLRAEWKSAAPERKAEIEAEVARLTTEARGDGAEGGAE